MVNLLHRFLLVNDWISDAFGKIQESAPIVRSLHAGFENCGFGRIIELSEPISLNTAVKALKAHLKLEKRNYYVLINFIISISSSSWECS